jgi:hypothetical protein
MYDSEPRVDMPPENEKSSRHPSLPARRACGSLLRKPSFPDWFKSMTGSDTAGTPLSASDPEPHSRCLPRSWQTRPFSAPIKICITPKNLLGAMWLQLAQAIEQDKQFIDGGPDCPSCRGRATVAHASRTYCGNTQSQKLPSSKGGSGSPHAKGKSIAEISKELMSRRVP